MIPWALVSIAVVSIASGAFGYIKGRESAEAEQMKTELLIKQAAEAAQQASAEVVAQIKVKNTVIKREIQREVKSVPVYTDCRNTDVGMQHINKALSGAYAPNDSKLPRIPGGTD
jgi:alpha-D-ribose 1-methylphosphonate 5-triphosphate synthase subunit PhnG